jgi:hypothetical protein
MRQLKKKRCGRLGIEGHNKAPLSRCRNVGYNRYDRRVLNSAGKNGCNSAIMMLVVRMMMNEFMELRANCQDHCPVQHCQ